MSEITSYNELKFSEILGDLTHYKNNPFRLKTIILDRLSDMVEGKVNLVDPSNPFVYLLEASCVNTALFIQENTTNARKMYPRLAVSEEDLYSHMSDYDYIDRFATPSETNLEVFISLNEFERYAVDDPDTNSKQITLPRDSKISISDFTFTINYPIIISKHYNGVYTVRYELGITSPIERPPGNLIDFSVISTLNKEVWLSFKTRVKQIDYRVVEYPVEKSRVMSDDISINDKFYYARVFCKSGNVWKELITTHTDQVFDPITPTAVIKVFSDKINVFIPPVYGITNQISGTIVTVIYTTKGKVDVNFSNFKMDDITYDFNSINKTRDYDTSVDGLVNTAKYFRVDTILNGGSDSLNFNELRETVIDNAIGDRKLPVTFNQFWYDVNRNGFGLERNIDIITNRQFVVFKTTPRAIEKYPITEAHLNMTTVVSSIRRLLETTQVLKQTSDRCIIPKDSVFTMENGRTRLLEEYELLDLKGLDGLALLEKVNNNIFLSSLYHYVLDTSNTESNLRAYHLALPFLNYISYESYNETVQQGANSKEITINKTDTGYKLYVKSNMLYYRSNISADNITPYLIYKDTDGSEFYFKSNIFFSDGLSPIYSFELTTAGDIDENGYILINNSISRYGSLSSIKVKLDDKFDIIYTINDLPDTYKESQDDYYIKNAFFVGVIAVISRETVSLHLGDELKWLWRNIRISSDETAYKTYSEDIYGYYKEDVYDVDRTTGVMFYIDKHCNLIYTKLHNKGDPILDVDGNHVILYPKGSMVLDQEGNPIPLSKVDLVHHADLLLIDYRARLTTKKEHINYYRHLLVVLTNWIVYDLAVINRETLENTKVYFRPKKSIDYTPIRIDNNLSKNIQTRQQLMVTVYVKYEVYNNTSMKENLNYELITTINTYIGNKDKVSRSDLIKKILLKNEDIIESIEIHGLAGELDLEIVILLEEDKSLSLDKKLILTPSNEYDLIENIDITYRIVDNF